MQESISNFLEPIAMDSTTVVCPFIDVIAYDNFEYRAQDEGARGAFDCKKKIFIDPLHFHNLTRNPFNFRGNVL